MERGQHVHMLWDVGIAPPPLHLWQVPLTFKTLNGSLEVVNCSRDTRQILYTRWCCAGYRDYRVELANIPQQGEPEYVWDVSKTDSNRRKVESHCNSPLKKYTSLHWLIEKWTAWLWLGAEYSGQGKWNKPAATLYVLVQTNTEGCRTPGNCTEFLWPFERTFPVAPNS